MLEFIRLMTSAVNAFSSLIVNGAVPFLIAFFAVTVVFSLAAKTKSMVRNAVLASLITTGFFSGGSALSFVKEHLSGAGQAETFVSNVADYNL